MEKKLFTTSDSYTLYEAYDGGVNRGNKWANPCFTREQVEGYLGDTPYDFRVSDPHTALNPSDDKILIIYFEDEVTVPVTHFTSDDGQELEGYCLPGEWMLSEFPYTTCQCSDPGCSAHKGESHCGEPVRHIMFRMDMDDKTGTPMCEICSWDAFESGVFQSDES